jgi:anti-sigma regulatory factor (Ser/Thr protein kinase)
VRAAVATWAARAGLGSGQVADFVLAVHEIAVNAVVHGSPAARLLLREQDGMAVAEVSDHGRWQPPAAPTDDMGRAGGMGLPLARQVCDQVDIQARPDGTTVLLGMRLAGRKGAGG